ncbi:MAG: hypothetical protein ACT4P6_12295 [Gemmatimonadaceae bacterium]
MGLLATLGLLAQVTATAPVLAFPEAGLDDSVAYRGYQTRFHRDAAGNTVQIYLDRREGRVVHVWANAENESVGLSVRDARGAPASLRWGAAEAAVERAGRARALEYALTSDATILRLGWFLLGSMRVERDFQAQQRHKAPFDAQRFVLPELARLLSALERLEPSERSQHLAHLNAANIATLRARLHPTINASTSDSVWVARVVQPALDGRDTLALDLRVDSRRINASLIGRAITLRSRDGRPVEFTLRIATTGVALTPVSQQEIFTPEFLAFVAQTRAAGSTSDSAAVRARWLERQVRGVELLASREKLMAGLPTYGTYFGRDMLMSALMMRPIWRDEMSEFVIASALRKLSPAGQVSHEEALGGQAARESAAEYASVIDEYLLARRRGDRVAADSLLTRARSILRDHRRVRENYNMIDDDLHLPVLAARWLTDPDVPAARKRAFLLDASDGAAAGTRLDRLVRELALVARMTDPYGTAPSAANLISFAPRDSGRWASTSWRDSNVGYAGGRYAMDVNAIWSPHALSALAQILTALRELGFSTDSLAQREPAIAAATPLGRYARDSAALGRAVDAWSGAWRHFLVQLGPREIRTRVAARLAALPQVERTYWNGVLTRTQADRDSLSFLALALDADAKPIAVANSDPATGLFLGDPGAGQGVETLGVLRDARLFVRPYPVGLFIEGVGPVVANDAFAAPPVWRAFERDRYHGPRVAWGREVNLFILGIANHVEATHAPGHDAYIRELRAMARRVQAAVDASGFQSELWTYTFDAGRPRPVRYGSGADVQLWSTTDLAVQFALWRLTRTPSR